MRKQTALHLEHGVPVTRIGVMAAFGCNYQGDIAPGAGGRHARGRAGDRRGGGRRDQAILAGRHDGLGDAACASSACSARCAARWPDKPISLHLHDTRGLAVANAHAGLQHGRQPQFDSTVGGLGGCPFAGQKGAAGNICTEELVLLCEEMGIETGVDLDTLIEVGRMAEEIVGHQLPSELIHAGSLDAFRRKAA